MAIIQTIKIFMSGQSVNSYLIYWTRPYKAGNNKLSVNEIAKHIWSMQRHKEIITILKDIA